MDIEFHIYPSVITVVNIPHRIQNTLPHLIELHILILNPLPQRFQLYRQHHKLNTELFVFSLSCYLVSVSQPKPLNVLLQPFVIPLESVDLGGEDHDSPGVVLVFDDVLLEGYGVLLVVADGGQELLQLSAQEGYSE